MTHRDITRKEFLTYLGSFLGLFVLTRLPGGGTSRPSAQWNPGSYGNHPYGGAKSK